MKLFLLLQLLMTLLVYIAPLMLRIRVEPFLLYLMRLK